MNIQGYNLEAGYWAKDVPETSFKFVDYDSYEIAYTPRNYFYDSKKKKVRYETMKVHRLVMTLYIMSILNLIIFGVMAALLLVLKDH